MTICACFISERGLFASFNKGWSIRFALYEQSGIRLTTAQTRADMTMNETHVFDMHGEINSAPLAEYLDSRINEACMDKPAQAQLTR